MRRAGAPTNRQRRSWLAAWPVVGSELWLADGEAVRDLTEALGAFGLQGLSGPAALLTVAMGSSP
jgi:hypothetical protein